MRGVGGRRRQVEEPKLIGRTKKCPHFSLFSYILYGIWRRRLYIWIVGLHRGRGDSKKLSHHSVILFLSFLVV